MKCNWFLSDSIESKHRIIGWCKSMHLHWLVVTFYLHNCILCWTDIETCLICLKVKVPREYIKLSPLSSAIIPHRTADGHLTKTGYVKLSAFSQVVVTSVISRAFKDATFYDLAYYQMDPLWTGIYKHEICFSYESLQASLFHDRLLLLIWNMQFMKWKVRMCRHIYLICGIIQYFS